MWNHPALAVVLAFASQLIAADTAPHFDIATLKRSPPIQGDSYSIDLGTIRNGRLTLTNTTLSDCLKFAWGLPSDDLISGPDWIKSKLIRFDIVAQVQSDTPREQVMLMTQALLTDRLHLTFHFEPRERRYLALVTSKSGPPGKTKLEPADLSQPRDNSGGNGRLTANHASMGLVATMLSRFEKEIIVDRTGLTGEFQVNLHWTPGTAGPDMAADDATGASLFAAIQEQLGLKLESRKGPIDTLTIDSTDQTPADN